MRKALLPALGMVAAAAMLVGCSSSSKSGGGNTSPPPASNTQQQTATTSGSGSTGAANSACKPDVVVQFCETIDITGAVTVKGTGVAVPEFDQGAGGLDLKCATWPTHQPENSDYPQFKFPNDPVDGHKLQTAPWKFPAGVGTSDISKYAGVNTMSIDSAGFQDTAVDVNNTTASSGTMQINADGSGALTFKDLGGETGKVSGSITWTCLDPQS